MDIVEVILQTVWVIMFIVFAYRLGMKVAREAYKAELYEKYHINAKEDERYIEMLRKKGVYAVDLSLEKAKANDKETEK